MSRWLLLLHSALLSSFVLLFVALVVALLGAAPAVADVHSFEVQEYQRALGVSAEEAEENLELQQRGWAIVTHLKEALGKRYAGVWFDNKAGEFVIPSLPGVGASMIQAPLAEDRLGRDFRIQPAESSWTELEKAQKELNTFLQSGSEIGSTETFIDSRTNAVVIRQATDTSVTEERKAQSEAAQSSVAVEIRAQIPMGHVSETLCRTETFGCETPLRGGMGLYEGTGSGPFAPACTIAFKAIGDNGGRYVLTAGHCQEEKKPTEPTEWSASDPESPTPHLHWVGEGTEQWSFPGGDWAKINATGAPYWDISPWPTGVVIWPKVTEETPEWLLKPPQNNFVEILGEGRSYPGLQVCHSGTATGSSCGIVSSANQSYTYEGGEVIGHATKFSSTCVEAGDSGGPVFAGNIAYGILSGGEWEASSSGICQRTGIYVEIVDADSALGVNVGPGPPVAETGGTNGLQPHQITANGTVDPNGLSTTYYFEYGETTGYGSSTSGQSAGSGWSPGGVNATIAGLKGLRTYHYRLVGSNSAGTSYGQDQQFTTPDWRPIVVTEPPTGVEAQRATLNGTVNPQGEDTHYHFEYTSKAPEHSGEQPPYDHNVPIPDADVGSGTTAVALSQKLEGLEDGTYHFRIVATNEEGTSYGNDREFVIDNRPLSIPEAATNVGTGNATLHAKVDPQGFASTYRFEYTRGNSFSEKGYEGATKVPIPDASVGSGNEYVAVSQSIEMLEPETTYHFRVAATNVKGTKYSEDRTFDTKTVSSTFEFSFGSLGSGNGQLNHPKGVAIDSSGNVWVADSENNRVEEFNPKGEYVAKFGSKGTAHGQFNKPIGIAIDGANNIWVADSGNHRVQKFNSKGEYLDEIGSEAGGTDYTAPGQFVEPWGVAMGEKDSTIWVVDRGFNRIEQFGLPGKEFVQEIHGAGYGGSGNGELNAPTAVATEKTAPYSIWVADAANNRVQKFVKGEKAGEGWKYGGQFGTKGSGNGQFEEPQAVAVKPSGNILVADRKTGRVQQLTPSGEYQTQFGAGQLSEPGGLAAVTGGAVYVSNTANNRVERWQQPLAGVTTEAATAITTHQATLNGAVNPHGISTTYRFEYGKTTAYGTSVPVPYKAAGSGTSEVKESQALVGLESETTYHFRLVASNVNGTIYGKDTTLTTKAPTPVFGISFGSLGSGNGQLNKPKGLAVDSSGNVWVADTENNRLEKFGAKGEYLSQFGSKGSGNGQFNKPTAVAIDGEGNLWVTDSANHRVQKLNPKGEFLGQVGSLGGGGFDYTAPGQFVEPWGVAMGEKDSTLWVSDRGYGRLEEFKLPSGEFMREVHGAGRGGAGNGELNSPTAIATEKAEPYSLWVTDTGNNRVQKFIRKAESGSESWEYGGQFGTKGSGNGQFEEPQAIALKPSGNLLVADRKTGRVQQFTPSGEYQTQFGSGQFSEPAGLAAVTGGAVYVSNTANNRVERWIEPTAPKATTQPASKLATRGATLAATVNPGGLSTTYRFEYGKTTAYGTSVPVPDKNLGAGGADIEATEAISGLAPNTTYHFRIVATNAEGSSLGEDKTFTTLHAVPIATTEAASNVLTQSATLHATVNPEGFDTHYQFEYGKTTAYGTSVPVPSEDIGAEIKAIAVSKEISALEAGTTYHLRVTATSSEGTTNGKDFSLTTAGTAGQLSAMAITDPFNGSTSAVSNFSTNWSALGWASGSPAKGEDTATGWRPVAAYPTVNGASYSPTVTDTGPGIAAVATLATNPSSAERYFSIWLDMPTLSSTRAGYELRFTDTATNTYEVKLSKWVSGTQTILASKSGYSFSNGNSFAVVDQGGTVSAWTNTGSGFSQLLSASDSTFSSGNSAVEGAGNITRLTNFKVGQPLAPVSNMDAALKALALNDSFATNENPLSGGGAWAALNWDNSGSGHNTGQVEGGWGPYDAYSAINGAYWTKASFADTGAGDAVSALLYAKPNGTSRYFSLWLDMPTPASAHTGYELRFTETSSGVYEVVESKWVSGTKTALATKTGYSFATGSQFALVDKIGTVSVWTKTGSEYTQLLSASDSTFTNGYTGIEGSGNITRLKEFRSGPLAPF